MNKRLISLWVVLFGLCTPSLAPAQVQQGTGNFVVVDEIRYEIIDEDAKTVGVAVQEANCPTYVVIPESIAVEVDEETTETYAVTQINDEAFRGNPNLFKVKFAASITEIGDLAFENCEILTFDELPENLNSIGQYAFYGCNAIKRIKLPESVTTLGEGCFSTMASLQKAVLFSQVTELPYRAFFEDKVLEEVYLPEGLIKIGDEAFAWDTSLEEIKLPSTLEEIGDHAFIGGAPDRTGLKHIELPNSVKKIGLAFRHSGLHSVNLGNLEDVPDGAFESCYELREVVFSPNLKSIGPSAFSSCGANAGRTMTSLVLPESVTEIAENAFAGSNILSLEIGDDVTTLPALSCGTPKILSIGKGIRTIDPNAFDPSQIQIIKIGATIPPTVTGGFPLTEEQQRKITVIVESEEAKALYKEHQYWKEFNVVVLANTAVEVHLDGTTDIATAIYTASQVMPAEVTKLTISGHISDDDFLIMKENMLSLLTLDMSEADNTVIPAETFANKLSLETVVLPKGLTRVEDGAFAGCSAMNIEELPDGIEFIGTNAFANCERITISRMPESLKELGYCAFGDCVSIKSLTFGDQLETLHGVSFSSCDNLEYVDMSRATKLKDLSFNTFYLNFALKTLILPESLENIGYRSICNTALKTITLPGSLLTLEFEAMCENPLRVITFGEGLKQLPDGALANNTKLLTVNLPSTLESVHENTFLGNKKISAISCLAQDAPEASAAAFEDINTRTCVLSVPVPSFFSYLSAPGWGMFSNIQNTLEIDIPDEIEVTTVAEEDYQDLVETEESEQRALESTEENEVDPAARMRRLARLQEESDLLLNGSLFCQLRHGTVLATDENDQSRGYRIFIRSTNNQPLTSVKVNEVEMIDQLVDNSLVLPAGAFGRLVINGGKPTSAATDIAAELATPELNDVYDLTGRCVLVKASAEQIKTLDKGIYIIKGKKIFVK